MKQSKATKTKYSKTHQGYWADRLEKRTYDLSTGEVGVVEEWQVRIQYLGKREWFPLGSNNKVEAAKRAAEIYQSLRFQGWDQTIAKYKGVQYVKTKDTTLAEYFSSVEAVSTLDPKTFVTYCRCMRTMVSQIRNIPDTPRKYDYQGGGDKEWRARIDPTPLSYITPDRIRKWQKDYLTKAGNDPLKIRQAEHTVNKLVRNARSLFSKNILPRIPADISLPAPLPFEGITLLKSGSMRYRSQLDTAQLVKSAQEELASKYPETFKIFLLSLFAGLRRNEMDKLLWESIDWKSGCIRIEPTAYFSPKTETSIGSVSVDEAVLAILKDYHKKTKGVFVIESRVKPLAKSGVLHYRAEKHFRKLINWLRQHGVDTQSPIHTLRKEYGRLVTENYGIYAASKALRHAGIQITAAHYADDKRRIVVKMDEI